MGDTGKGREKKKLPPPQNKKKRGVYKTTEVNESPYLSAMSMMCKQRPFRTARHTIALFALQ